MREYKFDASVPRRMYPSDVTPLKNRCPECGTKLEKEHHCYAVAVEGGSGRELLLVGNDFGFFCGKCNVVVLDMDGFEKEVLVGAPPETKVSQFVVMGIVDLDAIPEGKWNVPLGSEDNPIPLVEFTNPARKTSG